MAAGNYQHVWAHWFNNRRLLGPIGGIPPAEFEAPYYAQAKPRWPESTNSVSDVPGALHSS